MNKKIGSKAHRIPGAPISVEYANIFPPRRSIIAEPCATHHEKRSMVLGNVFWTWESV